MAVAEIYDQLREKGLNPWMEEKNLLPGQNSRRESEKALRTARFVIIFFSSDSVSNRGKVQRQFKQALDAVEEVPDDEIFLIPVRLDDCIVPESFAYLHSCDIYRPEGFALVIQAIRSQLNQTEARQGVGVSLSEHKEKRKPTPPASSQAKPSTTISGNKNSFFENIEHKKWLIGAVLVPLLIATMAYWLPGLKNTFRGETPKFQLLYQSVRPDSGFYILPRNDAAYQRRQLHLEMDGFLFAGDEIAHWIEHEDGLRWFFDLKLPGIPKALLDDGDHLLLIGFGGETFSDTLMINFDSDAPVAGVRVSSDPGNPRNKHLTGKVANRRQPSEEQLEVQMVIYSDEASQPLRIPVKRVHDPNQELTWFEFDQVIEGLPELTAADSAYHQPFFAFQVTDPAGNKFYQRFDYAQFMTAGTMEFGVNFGDISFEKHLPKDLQPGRVRLAMRLYPSPEFIDRLPDGRPPLELSVSIGSGNIATLTWVNNIPQEQRLEKPLTVIYRNEKQLGATRASSFIDKEAGKLDNPSYRVEQAGRDGTVFGSNSAKAKTRSDTLVEIKPPDLSSELRASPFSTIARTLTIEDVRKLIEKHDFYVRKYDWTKGFDNSSGKGFTNDYKPQGEVVIDRASGLMWQQSGSQESMTYNKAQEYIKHLNEQRFAGYSDWRLPTLEEAMSLMEPQKQSNNLYIDPIFDGTQIWIWTADRYSAERAWFVNFFGGHCGHNPVGNSPYVRAVRSGTDNH